MPTSSRSSVPLPQAVRYRDVQQAGKAEVGPRTAGGRSNVANQSSSDEGVMKLFLQILLLVTSIALILLILLHRSRGGGLSSLFGGGVQSSLSGSSVVEKNLDRLTLFVSSVWVIAIVGIGLLIKIG
jgi:preprotein translocase subunit SecG